MKEGTIKMISPKALKKMNIIYETVRPDKIEVVTTFIAASNDLIEDITKKGELKLKWLNKS